MTDEIMTDEEMDLAIENLFGDNILNDIEELEFGEIIDSTTDFVMITPKVGKRFFWIPTTYYSLELIQEMFDKGFRLVTITENDFIFTKIKDD